MLLMLPLSTGVLVKRHRNGRQPGRPRPAAATAQTGESRNARYPG